MIEEILIFIIKDYEMNAEFILFLIEDNKFMIFL